MTRSVIVGLTAWAVACGDPEPQAETVQQAPRSPSRQTIVFVGTSLTAGLGVAAEDAYPALIQRQIDSAGLPYTVVNAGVEGASSAEGLARMPWLLSQRVDVLVLELGANDGLRGTSVEAMEANLQAAIDSTRARHPDARIVIAGMEAPPNMGRSYTAAFRRAFRDLAARNDAALIPFLLEGVAAEDSLNQDDGIHPNEAGHRVVAENVWRVLTPLLTGRT